MEITEVRITLRDDQKLRAFVSITLDDCFVVRGLKIIEGADGMFVAMPSRKRKDGEYQDIAHPINNKARKWMEEIIMKAYREELEKQKKLEKKDQRTSSTQKDLIEETVRSSEKDHPLQM